MSTIKIPDQETRSLVVVNSNTVSKGIAGNGGCLPVQGSSGKLAKASRIAGYGFISLSVMVGAIAAVILVIGGIFMIPSLVSTFRRFRARYYTSTPRMMR